MKAASMIFILLLMAPLVSGQQVAPSSVIQFRVASDDPAAKFSFKDWTVMAKFEGEIRIFETGTQTTTIHIVLKRGELLAPKSSKRIFAVTPFLSTKSGKSFKPVAQAAAPMKIDEVIQANLPYALTAHEFKIELPKNPRGSGYWLTFEISLDCESHAPCTTYAHSRGDIFAK